MQTNLSLILPQLLSSRPAFGKIATMLKHNESGSSLIFEAEKSSVVKTKTIELIHLSIKTILLIRDVGTFGKF